MTPEEFAAAMAATKCNPQRVDREYMHMEMDALMCRVLRELGYGAGIDVFEHTDKWYA